MRLINELTVYDGAKDHRISLCHGDLSAITADQPVDLLIVSAFPNSYLPLPGTLIGALHRRGLSLAELARDKERDLRDVSGFWVSKPLGERHADLNIGRIACFEPLVLGQPPQVVGELFRGLFPFLDEQHDSVVAMPLLGAGNQRWPPEAIFAPLLEAAYHWLKRGMAIAELRIVEIQASRIDDLERQFNSFERDYAQPDAPAAATAPSPATAPLPTAAPKRSMWRFWPFARSTNDEAASPPVAPDAAAPATDEQYDVFLSYAEEDKEAAEQLARVLREQVQGVRVFDYRLSIDVGQSWQQEIDEAIAGCRKIVALMSRDYFASPECTEELMIARLRNKRSNFEVFFPLYWKDAGEALALWLQAITYSDCREGDADRLGDVTRRLAEQLR